MRIGRFHEIPRPLKRGGLSGTNRVKANILAGGTMSDEIKKATESAESVPANAAPELTEEELKNVTGGVTENISLEYGKIEFKYKPQNPEGD